MDKLYKLIDKYFEGETDASEEKEIRNFFLSENIPDDLLHYKPIFSYFTEEINKSQVSATQVPFRKKKTITLWMSGIAACTLIVLTGSYFLRSSVSEDCVCAGNYVMINGRCYTDTKKIKEMTFKALEEIKTFPSDIFPITESDPLEQDIIQDQLNEFYNLFNE